jgi:hypothetical protein
VVWAFTPAADGFEHKGNKMENRLNTARQIVADVLNVRAAATGGVFRMHAVEPEHGMDRRHQLAAKFAHMVPHEATAGDTERLAMAIAPLLHHGVTLET